MADIVYTFNTVADYRGLTGSLGWNYQVSGKLATRLLFLVATGTSASYFAFTGIGPTTLENSQLSKVLRLSATYAATGKTTLTGTVGVVQNTYGQTTNLGTQHSTDVTPRIGLGVNYAPTRSTSLGCDANFQQRSASQEAIATGQWLPHSLPQVRSTGFAMVES